MKSTKISDFDQHCTVKTAKLLQRTNERVMLAFLLVISIKDIIRGPNGVFDFGHFRGARGTKITKLVEKSQSSLTN